MTLTIERSNDRLDQLSASGCVVCRKAHGAFIQGEIQHLTVGGRRMGDRYTISLCPWHHRAVPQNGLSPEYMEQIYGPSFAKSRERFDTAYGHDVQLLQETDRWLGIYLPDKDYQELKAGWHHSRAPHSSTVLPSVSSTTSESSQKDEKSSDGSKRNSQPSESQVGTNSPPSSPVSSPKKRSRKRT